MDASAAAVERADIVALHSRAVVAFDALVHRIGPDAWDLPTPCAGWSVRDLVAHVTEENLWTPPLLAGRTIADVGEAVPGDVLGDDPVGASASAAAAARAAAAGDGVTERTVHLSFGATPAREYLWQLFADHLVHGWDLAQAIGADDRLDADLVAVCASWFTAAEPLYREVGAIGPYAAVAPDADAQAVLLARFGRSAALATAGRFYHACADGDRASVLAHMTEDCVVDPVDAPADAGPRGDHGATAPPRHWDRRRTVEEMIAAGDRVVTRWTGTADAGGGIDVLRVRDGRIAEVRTYPAA